MPNIKPETVIQRVLKPKPYREPGVVIRNGSPRSSHDGRKKFTREEWKAQYREALKADPAFHRAMRKLHPRHAALLVAWAVNGNSIEKAAKAIGMKLGQAKKIFATEPFKEARGYVEAFRPDEDKLWIDLLPEARWTLRTLLKSDDDKVRYLAAKDIADRAEGKASQRIDLTVRDEAPVMTDSEMQLAFSIMAQAKLGFADTVIWMRAHPDEVREWVAKNVHDKPALPSGQDVSAIEEEFALHPEAFGGEDFVHDLDDIENNAVKGLRNDEEPPGLRDHPRPPPSRLQRKQVASSGISEAGVPWFLVRLT